MRLFLDTDVLIDYYLRRQPFFDDCVKLRILQAFGDGELWVSAKSFTDVFYIMKKVVDQRRIQSAFLNSTSFFNICSIDGADIKAAASLCWPDFEDCLVNIGAQKVKADYLITRDKKGFTQSSIKVCTPSELLSEYEEITGYSYEEINLNF